EKAAAKTQAVSGDTYVKLDCGLLTVNQINWLLRSVFGELTYCDDNHQLLWYNKNPDPNYRMMGKRRPDQIGSPMSEVHPNRGNVFKYVKQVWYGLRTKATGRSEVWTPVSMGHGQPILHYNRYKRIEDEEGNFRGIMEWVVDLQPLAEYYLKTNGLKAVKDEHPQRPDLVPSPGDIALEKKRQSTDANTAASQH
ncbi:PAS domain-containing protein, partial [Lactobacillus nasalidis]